MKFSKYKLGELLRVTRGASLPGTGYADEGRYLRLTLANFLEEGGFKDFKSTQGKYFVEAFDNRFLMHKGDLITPLTEQSPGLLGSVAFIPCDDLYIQSQDVGLITCNSEKLDKTFAYYLFLTRSVREQISARSQQTKIRHTSPDKIADVEVYLPDLPTQLRIAGILGSLDEKIELNHRKIAELEALAKTIYDYWFVQFDFPDKNGKPYRSSGGKMVWNEQLKREIPAGWCNGKLSDIAYYASDKLQSNAIPLENYVTTDSMLQNKQGRDIATSLPPPGTSIVCFCESDTLVANIRPYLQKIWFSNVQGGCSQDVLVFRAKKSCVPTFLYSTLWQDNFFDYVMTGAKGSKMPRGDKDHIMSYPLALPVESLLSQYNKIVGDFWSRRNFALLQITELTALRDLLLPLLMNGQVVVK